MSSAEPTPVPRSVERLAREFEDAGKTRAEALGLSARSLRGMVELAPGKIKEAIRSDLQQWSQVKLGMPERERTNIERAEGRPKPPFETLTTITEGLIHRQTLTEGMLTAATSTEMTPLIEASIVKLVGEGDKLMERLSEEAERVNFLVEALTPTLGERLAARGGKPAANADFEGKHPREAKGRTGGGKFAKKSRPDGSTSRRSRSASGRGASSGVKQIAELLDKLGFDLGDKGVDATGSALRAAISAAQKKYGLDETGSITTSLRSVLNREVARRKAKTPKHKAALSADEQKVQEATVTGAGTLGQATTAHGGVVPPLLASGMVEVKPEDAEAVPEIVDVLGTLAVELREAVEARQAAHEAGDAEAFTAAWSRERVIRGKMEGMSATAIEEAGLKTRGGGSFDEKLHPRDRIGQFKDKALTQAVRNIGAALSERMLRFDKGEATEADLAHVEGVAKRSLQDADTKHAGKPENIKYVKDNAEAILRRVAVLRGDPKWKAEHRAHNARAGAELDQIHARQRENRDMAERERTARPDPAMIETARSYADGGGSVSYASEALLRAARKAAKTSKGKAAIDAELAKRKKPGSKMSRRSGHDLLTEATSSASLPDLPNKPGKSNWVEKAGGLPKYIERIAKHLHSEKGMDVGRAIATAVNVVKKMCAAGDTNFPGKQQVNAGSQAQACAAVKQWESMKAKSKVSEAESLMEAARAAGERPFYPSAYEAFLIFEWADEMETISQLKEAGTFRSELHPRNRLGKFVDVLGKLDGSRGSRSALTRALKTHPPGTTVTARLTSGQGSRGGQQSVGSMRGPGATLAGVGTSGSSQKGNDELRAEIKRNVMARFGGDLMGSALVSVDVTDDDVNRYRAGASIDDLLAPKNKKGDTAAALRRDLRTEKETKPIPDAYLDARGTGADALPDLTALPVSELAALIRADWAKVNFGAVPYLDAMRHLNSSNDAYGLDSGKSVIAYFLANASGWRGETAKKVKAELNRRLKEAGEQEAVRRVERVEEAFEQQLTAHASGDVEGYAVATARHSALIEAVVTE